jgi:hypothetical protein
LWIFAPRVEPSNPPVSFSSISVDAPPPFEASSDRWAWHLPRNVRPDDLTAIATGSPAPGLPALVTIGRTDHGALLLDLKACGLVAVSGAPDDIQALLRAVALELTVSPAADWVDVVVVHDPALMPDPDHPEPLDVAVLTRERLRTVAALDEAVTLLEASSRSTGRLLDESGRPTTLAARASADSSDALAPTVMILPGLPDPETRARVEACTAAGRGTAVIAAGEWPKAPWELHVQDGHVDIARLGARATLGTTPIAQGLTHHDTTAAAQLLETARADAERAANAPEHVMPPRDAPLTQPPADHPSSYEEATFDIEVRVLGEIDIAGLTQPLDGVETELTVYLATHDRPIDADKVIAALWPKRAPSQQRWSNILNLVRKALGPTSDGELHLPQQRRSRSIALGPGVRCDLDRLCERLRAAEHADPDDRIRLLSEATELIRGTPFSKPPERRGGYHWTHTEGIYYYAESVTIDAAHLLARARLEHDDPHAALAAAAKGLAAVHHAELLYQDRMDAHHALGNPQAVAAEFDALLEAAEIIDPYGQLQPDTLHRYEEYTHRPISDLPAQHRAAHRG